MVYTFGRHNFNVQQFPFRFWRVGRFVDPRYPEELKPQPLCVLLGPLCVTYWRAGDHCSYPRHPAPAPLDAALQEAATAGDTAQIAMLITKGADINSRDESGVPILMHAVHSGSTEVVLTLLAAGADPDSEVEESHINALMWATIETPEIVQALLEHGANPNAVEAHSESGTALLWAMQRNKTSVAITKLLISYGADVNAQNFAGETPLILLQISTD